MNWEIKEGFLEEAEIDLVLFATENSSWLFNDLARTLLEAVCLSSNIRPRLCGGKGQDRWNLCSSPSGMLWVWAACWASSLHQGQEETDHQTCCHWHWWQLGQKLRIVPKFSASGSLFPRSLQSQLVSRAVFPWDTCEQR